MMMSLFGIEECLEIKKGQINLLNIKNRVLAKQIYNFFVYNIEEDINDVVFLDDEKRLGCKQISYVHDVISYSFNSKKIVDSIVKLYLSELNQDLELKNTENKLYTQLVKPLMIEIDRYEIEYDSRFELDPAFYSKIIGIDFQINDRADILDKIQTIIKIEAKLFNKKVFIFSRLLPLLTNEELIMLNDYVNNSNISLVLIDNVDDSLVKIPNNLCIDDDYGVYRIKC